MVRQNNILKKIPSKLYWRLRSLTPDPLPSICQHIYINTCREYFSPTYWSELFRLLLVEFSRYNRPWEVISKYNVPKICTFRMRILHEKFSKLILFSILRNSMQQSYISHFLFEKKLFNTKQVTCIYISHFLSVKKLFSTTDNNSYHSDFWRKSPSLTNSPYLLCWINPNYFNVGLCQGDI